MNAYQRTGRMAKSAIDNCRAGRAAKGENPLLCAKQKHAHHGVFFCLSKSQATVKLL